MFRRFIIINVKQLTIETMKTSKLFFSLLILFFYANAYSAELTIKSRTENTIELSIKGDNKSRSIITIRTSAEPAFTPDFAKTYKYLPDIDISKSEKYKNNYIIYDANKSEDIKITSLKAETKYLISIFEVGAKNSKNTDVYTLATEPKKQTSGLAFKNITDSQIEVLWVNGDGKEKIICVSADGSVPAKPVDGKIYKSGKFGDAACKIDNSNTYVVYNSAEAKSKNQFLIKNLEYGKYTIQIFEYNGKDETINYNTENEKNNPRVKHTLFPAPVALDATNITKDGFLAHWKEMKNVKYFEFDLSTDPKFETFVDLYKSADVGTIDSIELVELAAGTYYYRLRAVTNESKSANSNVIKLEIK